MRQKWTRDSLQKEALKYQTRGEFRQNSGAAAIAAHRRGIFEEICSHMLPKWLISSGENSVNFTWTNESLKLEAMKYSTRIDFMRSGVAYQAAYKRGILDEICAHMNESPTKPWDGGDLALEALNYKTRAEFQNKSSGAYQAAKKRGMLDEICQHMKKDSTVSQFERELCSILKEQYPSLKKLRDRKVKIFNKPYIKGFDIDIFVPEILKGIEFDGKYWHSFEKMRKDPKRKKWSDDDIVNYHEIKDKYFLSIGIQILHINEIEWINNKDLCIQKCFSFFEGS